MTEFADVGYATPEEAARGDIPVRFATVVGSLVLGDVATVWLLTNDKPPFEPYEVNCERQSGCWHFESGFGSFGRATQVRSCKKHVVSAGSKKLSQNEG